MNNSTHTWNCKSKYIISQGDDRKLKVNRRFTVLDIHRYVIVELVCDHGYVLPMLLSQRNSDQLLLMLANWLVLCERMHSSLAANLVLKGTGASHKCCAVHNTPLQPSSQALGCSLYMGRPLCTICLSIYQKPAPQLASFK